MLSPQLDQRVRRARSAPWLSVDPHWAFDKSPEFAADSAFGPGGPIAPVEPTPFASCDWSDLKSSASKRWARRTGRSASETTKGLRLSA